MGKEGSYEGWGIVELLGHNVIAGYISEAAQYGVAMCQVDVPAIEVGGVTKPAYTKYFGGSAIYAITPTGESEARRAAQRLDKRPVSLWVVPDPQPALPTGKFDAFDNPVNVIDRYEDYVDEGED